MQQPAIPRDEKQRMAALLSAELLDTEAEPRFDRITTLVKQCLGTQIVLVSLVDTGRQWFKSRQGLNACETGRDISFCGHAILTGDIFEIADASQAPRFADNPLVTAAPFIRFYAGAPLSFNGQRIGTLCIIDAKPRQLTLAERQILRQFADIIEQEITDRLQEQVHQQLAASELMYRSVLEGTSIGTWQWNVHTGATVFNERWAEIIGYSLAELSPVDINTWLSFAHPDDLAESGRLLEQHFSGQLPFYDCKCRMKHKAGHWVWVHDRGRVVSWTEDGKPLMMYGTHADITEQKQAELKLFEQRWLYEQILEQSMAGYWDWEIQDGKEYLSPGFKKMFGYADDEMENKPEAWQKIIFKEDLDLVLGSFNQHVLSKGESPFDNIIRYHHKDGSTVWVRCVGKVIEWTDEKTPLRMVGCHINLTKEMNIRSELQASRDQFQTLVANIPGITYRCKVDKDWTMLYMSGSIDPLSGYPACDFINNEVRSYASVIHPDDRERLDLAVGQAINDNQNWLLQYRIIHKSGAIRWVEERGRAEYTESGDVIYLDGFILDITEEKTLKQQLLKLTSQLPGVVYQYQQWPDGRACFPYASDNIQKIYGALPEQVKDDATFIFGKIHPDDLAGLANSIEVSAAHLSLWQNQYRVCLENKQPTWLSGRATPERMPDGSTLWHGYIEDITTTKKHYLELERLNKEYKLSQQRLEMASETALIGFWQASLKTGELWWSPVIYQIFGFDNNITPSVALFKSTLHPQDRHLVAASEQQALETGLHDVIHRIIRPDGTIRWVHELAKMLPVAENPEQILVGSVQDVTERMQLQQMKDSFISTVSHELRTPLTAIKGALGLLNSGKLGQVPETMLKLMQVASSNSDRLAKLINDLLDIEKLAAGKMPFDMQPLSVLDELRQAVDNLQPFANQHHVTIDLQPIPAQWLVQADSLRLQQVVTNLLSNAIKFSPKNTSVLVSAQCQSGSVLFQITDTGSGIPIEFQSHIFERFAQADGSNQRQSGGTGLGLAICKELVQQMGGSIGFNSAAGKGTTFYFALPEKPYIIS
ncbi:PAS domain-containing protein [Arsukibacterium sp.]|uniref:PAS domain-containing protein n=1 Tax=Arsukibacterium sp. TaxID=1977258 RepID=UPI002FDB45E0